MRYLKVMPVTLPTIAYKLASLTIVSTISGLWIIIQHLIVLPCISLVLLIFLSWRMKIVSKLLRHVLGPRTSIRLLSMCSNSFTMPMNTLWSNQNKNVQVKMMRCTVWITFLLNGVTLVMCYMLKEQDFWFSHMVHLDFRYTAPWLKNHMMVIITIVLILGFISCVLTEVYMKLDPELILYIDEAQESDTTEPRQNKDHGENIEMVESGLATEHIHDTKEGEGIREAEGIKEYTVKAETIQNEVDNENTQMLTEYWIAPELILYLKEAQGGKAMKKPKRQGPK